jgi:hypothetical protein
MDLVAFRVGQLLRALVGACLVSLRAISVRTIDGGPTLCLYRRLTGSPCPGCGLTHSLWFLLHGQMAAAWQWNKMGILFLPAAIAFAIAGWPARRPRWRWPEPLGIPRDQIKVAAWWVWAILSLVFAITLAASAILPEGLVMRLTPVCERKARTGLECPLCGMTHAFLSISRARFRTASNQNAGSLPLYAALFFNEGLFVLGLIRGRRPQSRMGAASVWTPQPWRRQPAAKGELKC